MIVISWSKKVLAKSVVVKLRGRFRRYGDDKIRETPPRTPDKQAAEQRLNKITLELLKAQSLLIRIRQMISPKRRIARAKSAR